MSSAQGSPMIPDHGANGSVPAPRDAGHWAEILLNRIEQLEFTLSRETGIEGELLGAVGELGARIDMLDQQLAAGTARDIGQVIAVFDALNTHLAAGRLPAPPPQTETMARVEDLCRQTSDEMRHLSDLIVAIARKPPADIDPETLRVTAARVLGRLLSAIKRQGRDQQEGLTDLGDRIEAIAQRLAEPPSARFDTATVTEALETLAGKVDLLRQQGLPRHELASLGTSVDRLSTWLDAAADGSDRRLDALDERLARIEARLAAREGEAEAATDRFDALGARLADRLDRGLDRLVQEIRTTGAPAAHPDIATDQRRSIARLMTALNGWSHRQELLHERTGAMLTDLLAHLGGMAAHARERPDGDAGRDALADEVRSLFAQNGDRIESILQDVLRQVIALRQSGDVDRLGARIATALAGLARTFAAGNDAIGARLDAMAKGLPELPDDPETAHDLRLASAAQALHVLLSRLPHASGPAFDAMLEDRRQALRVAVAETLARTERHLS